MWLLTTPPQHRYLCCDCTATWQSVSRTKMAEKSLIFFFQNNVDNFINRQINKYNLLTMQQRNATVYYVNAKITTKQ